MAFEKEPRYVVTRIREDGGRVYMNDNGEETSIRPTFGATWSCHEPGLFTYHQALKRSAEGDAKLSIDAHKFRPECLWKPMIYDPKAPWN